MQWQDIDSVCPIDTNMLQDIINWKHIFFSCKRFEFDSVFLCSLWMMSFQSKLALEICNQYHLISVDHSGCVMSSTLTTCEYRENLYRNDFRAKSQFFSSFHSFSYEHVFHQNAYYFRYFTTFANIFFLLIFFDRFHVHGMGLSDFF